ncbi:hypothetical protein [Enterobacter sp. R4-368]|uniref:hypothetical protein n=1 Tax=Enterobacter sp. R4-368 TaxID=1166130 RepID=UPI00034F1E3E|nr:hypothetical protein [Enterobacter sp. R4-368]AGN86873.1 hypothetical protein H650_17690 [Enterobacter sp. R4-368]
MINKVITFILLNIVSLYSVQDIVWSLGIGSEAKLFNCDAGRNPVISNKNTAIQHVKPIRFFVMNITVFRVRKE